MLLPLSYVKRIAMVTHEMRMQEDVLTESLCRPECVFLSSTKLPPADLALLWTVGVMMNDGDLRACPKKWGLAGIIFWITNSGNHPSTFRGEEQMTVTESITNSVHVISPQTINTLHLKKLLLECLLWVLVSSWSKSWPAAFWPDTKLSHLSWETQVWI